jgi:hypothetical protein
MSMRQREKYKRCCQEREESSFSPSPVAGMSWEDFLQQAPEQLSDDALHALSLRDLAMLNMRAMHRLTDSLGCVFRAIATTKIQSIATTKIQRSRPARSRVATSKIQSSRPPGSSLATSKIQSSRPPEFRGRDRLTLMR